MSSPRASSFNFDGKNFAARFSSQGLGENKAHASPTRPHGSRRRKPTSGSVRLGPIATGDFFCPPQAQSHQRRPAAAVEVDGKSYELANLDCLYTGMGAKVFLRRRKFFCCPAHQTSRPHY
jgi:hypothetical protein